MLAIAYGYGGCKAFVRRYLCCVMMNMLLGGVLQFFKQMLPARAYDLLLPISGVVLMLFVVAEGIRQTRKQAYREVAFLVADQVEHMVALADTGNGLRDPLTGRAVCVVSDQWKDRWVTPQQTLRCIPYETVAGKDFMEVIPVEKFLVKQQGQMQWQKDMMIGFGKASLFQGKKYQMILHKDYC